MERYPELDAWRGAAVIAMIAFHFLFDLNYFADYSLNLSSGMLWGLGRFAGISFLLLVGICLPISHERVREQPKEQQFRKYLFRGVTIFCCGLLITLATFLFAPAGTIVFGILHLIGFSIIACFPLLEKKEENLLLGILLIAFGLFTTQYSWPLPFLVWLGFPFPGFYSFDYYPVLPWMGVVLLGLFLGNTLYTNRKPRVHVHPVFAHPFSQPLLWAGRNSLALYLLHQLVLIPLVIVAF